MKKLTKLIRDEKKMYSGWGRKPAKRKTMAEKYDQEAINDRKKYRHSKFPRDRRGD